MTTPFAQRRKKLKQAMAPNSMAIIPANTVQYRNSDVEHLWRQSSNYRYFTNIDEADGLCLISNVPEQPQFIVFCLDKDPKKEVWDGVRIGSEKIVADYQADASYPLSQLAKKMPELLDKVTNLYFDWGDMPTLDNQIYQWIQQIRSKIRLGVTPPSSIHFLTPIIGELRLIKDDSEIELMKQAAQISVVAHKQAMLSTQQSDNESQVMAELEYQFHRQGAKCCAFGSIVAHGANACTLHYRANNQAIDGSQSLMLIDGGAEYQGYASDITTTFPARGKFTPEQKAIYELVLDVQQQVVQACRNGQTIDDLHQLSCRVITQGLLSIGLLQGELEQLIEDKKYTTYYMHRIGHWIGMDVHDVGNYRVDGQWRPLQPNMLLTIEPGIYINPDENLDSRWWNIGVRIEDSVLITDNGNEVITDGLPRTVNEIEAFLNQ